MKRISVVILIAPVLLLVGCSTPLEQPTGPQHENTESNSGSSTTAISDETDSATRTDVAAETASSVESGSVEINEPKKTADVEFGEKFPEVLAVKVKLTKDNSYRFDVTLSSVYDSRERYADAWRVLDENDNELGVRVLMHDHASEQPFTRSKSVTVPSVTRTVFVEGRDQANGWSGQRFKVELTSSNTASK